MHNVEGSGSGYMNGYKVDIPFEEIKKLAEKQGISAVYCQGYWLPASHLPTDTEPEESQLEVLARCAEEVDIILAFVGALYGYEAEWYDRPHIRLPKNQQAMLDVLTEKAENVVIVLTGGSVYDLAPWNGRVKGVIFAGMAGEGYGKAIAEILFGKAQPGGRLTETFPLRRAWPCLFRFYTGL